MHAHASTHASAHAHPPTHMLPHTHALLGTGIFLARHPTRPLCVPLVQPSPVLSADREAEVAGQQERLQQLAAQGIAIPQTWGGVN